MLSFFKRKPAPVIQVLQRDPCRLKMEEWRSSADLTRAAAKALSDPIIQQMMDVVRADHPGYFSPGPNATIEGRAFHSATCEGYSAALSNFELLGVHSKPAEHMESTFAEPERE